MTEYTDIDVSILFYFHENYRVTHPDYGPCLDLLEIETKETEYDKTDIKDLVECGLLESTNTGYYLYSPLGLEYVQTFKLYCGKTPYEG